MTIDAANALYRYFETLYYLNQSLIILCGVDVIDNRGHYEKHIEDVIQAVPRLVPYKYNWDISDHAISVSDGLMEFAHELPFLKGDYEMIFLTHKEFLIKVKKIRNKLEHKLHGAKIVASSSGSVSFFAITYEVAGEDIEIEVSEIIGFVKEINTMFSKIQTEVEQFAYKNKLDDHPCYWKLTRYRFSEFNKIFESNLLRTFGKALLPF